jgi:hypothetical protein
MAILAKGTPAALFIFVKWPFSRPPGRPHFVNRRSTRKVKMGLKWYEQGNFERPYLMVCDNLTGFLMNFVVYVAAAANKGPNYYSLYQGLDALESEPSALAASFQSNSRRLRPSNCLPIQVPLESSSFIIG